MKNKITSLTKEQENRLEEFKEKWLKIGLCTNPANRPLAEDALIRSYKMAGLTPPKQIIWTTSPLAGCILISILKDEKLLKKFTDKKINTGDSVGDSVRDSVGASVRDSVGASVRDSVGDSVWDSVGDSVWDSVRDSVWASVRDSVGDSVRDSVGASVRDSVGDSVRDSVGASVRDSVGASVRDSVGDSVWDSVGDSVWDSVRDSVWASVRDSVGASVRDSVGASVRDSVGASVRDSVGASVRDSVGASVRDSVGASVRDSVGASVRDSVGASVRDSVRSGMYGQFDAAYLGYIDYFKEVLNLVEETKKIVPLSDLSKHSNWIYPYKNIAIISEKPIKINVNENGKIHCLNGPAILYKDGFAIYGINGKRIVEGTEEYKKLLHQNKFNEKMDKLLE